MRRCAAVENWRARRGRVRVKKEGGSSESSSYTWKVEGSSCASPGALGCARRWPASNKSGAGRKLGEAEGKYGEADGGLGLQASRFGNVKRTYSAGPLPGDCPYHRKGKNTEGRG